MVVGWWVVGRCWWVTSCMGIGVVCCRRWRRWAGCLWFVWVVVCVRAFGTRRVSGFVPALPDTLSRWGTGEQGFPNTLGCGVIRHPTMAQINDAMNQKLAQVSATLQPDATQKPVQMLKRSVRRHGDVEPVIGDMPVGYGQQEYPACRVARWVLCEVRRDASAQVAGCRCFARFLAAKPAETCGGCLRGRGSGCLLCVRITIILPAKPYRCKRYWW
jgi:hypothetical protein